MKLVFFSVNTAHQKNVKAIIRMCKSYNIDLEFTNFEKRLYENNYDILICNDTFVDWKLIPENIKIIYGPQHFIFPENSVFDAQYDSSSEKRCVYNSLSSWVADVFLENTSGKFLVDIVQFPFSLDTELFADFKNEIKTFDCLIYIKNREDKLIQKCMESLSNLGMTFKIVRYGYYQEKTYIEYLKQCKFMLVIDAHESQGFAILEAMCSNVPLLVLNATSMHDEVNNQGDFTYKDRKQKLLATSVPYWSDHCGVLIYENEMNSLKFMMQYYSYFNPRKYILENLTDEICMKRILDYFNF